MFHEPFEEVPLVSVEMLTVRAEKLRRSLLKGRRDVEEAGC